MADSSPPTALKRARLNEDARLARHLSKSASELNGRECSNDSTGGSPQRAKSAANPSVTGVIQKTHGFFSTLKHRLSRGRSKERLGRKSPIDFENESTDYAADNSSENSSSVTPAHTPRHRATTVGGSPLARDTNSRTEILNYEINVGDVASAITQSAMDLLHAEEQQRKREANLRQHVFFQLRVHLRTGHNLIAMDKNGSSDPYVKFKLAGRLLHKSRTVHRDLNPVWDEIFTVHIEDPFQPIIIKVFDYDWGLQDDFMGSAKLDLTELELERQQDLSIKLEDLSKPNRDLGEIKLTVTLWPRTQEDKEMRNQKLVDSSKKLKSQIWSSVVAILLVEAKNITHESDGSPINEPHIRFRLGNEKYKSKTSYRARWLEQFDFHLFDEDQILEVALWSKNSVLGRCTIDLSKFPRESTHGIWQQFEDHHGEVFLMLTISGTTASETISDLTAYKEDPREKEAIFGRYLWYRTFQRPRDIGHLTVKVFGATGLVSADIGGKSDPFCVLELDNARLQTQTEYKTLAPNWNKIFTFNVKDISSALEVTVFDEDRDHKVEFLGKIVIPLLRIRNGVKHWYALKDKKLHNRAKGNNPQILLELNVVWNPIRAAIRLFQPKEDKLVHQEPKFKRQLFLQNVNRMKSTIMEVIEVGRYINGCIEWENPIRSIIALFIWTCSCLWAGLEIVPVSIVLIILKNWFIRWLTGNAQSNFEEHLEYITDEDEDDNPETEQKKTIKERLHAIQEVSQTVQNTIGSIASLGESIKNTMNFTIPEITWLVTFLLLIVGIILRFMPIRVLLIIWGFWKFSKRLIRPNAIPNNEVIDILSRVPDNEQIIIYRELQLQSSTEQPKREPRKKFKLT